MARTEIHAVTATLPRAIEYICNYDKTDLGKYITCHNCTPETAHLEFKISANDVLTKNGNYRKENAALAYHMTQSFAIGETTADKAHDIGIKTAQEFLKDNHDYIVTTHIDKQHIHNHIIFNPVNNKTKKLFYTKNNTFYALRKISDRICTEHDLSIIKNPKDKSTKWYIDHMNELGVTNKESYRDILKQNIDTAISLSANFESYVKKMQEAGYKVKQYNQKGKFLKTISYKGNGQERYIRDDTLGDNYSREAIKKRIDTHLEEVKSMSPIQQITIAKKLIKRQNDDAYFTKIPGKPKYIFIPKDSSEMINDGKTLSTFIDRNEQYKIYNINGKLIETAVGSKLQNIYDDAKKNYENYLKSFQKLSSITDIDKTFLFKLTNRLVYQIKRDNILNVQKLSEALYTLRTEKIDCQLDFDQRIIEASATFNELNDKVKNLTSLLQEYEQIVNYISTYKKYINTVLEVEQNPILLEKFKQDIDVFNFSIECLQQLGVDPNIDEELLEEFIHDKKDELTQCQEDLKDVRRRISKINYTNEIIQDLVYKRKEIQKQKLHDAYQKIY